MINYSKSVLLFFNILFAFSIGLYAEQINPTKQEMWDNKSDEVSHWIDGAGYPIDKEIKETVIALNLMGIETLASCEGHLDRSEGHLDRSLYPWIEIQIYPPAITKLVQELSDVQEQESNEELVLKTKFPNLSYKDFFDIPEGENLRNLVKKHNLIAESITQIQLKCMESLNHLLNQFYENHKASYDNTLIVPHNSMAFLRSIGADRQQIRSQKEQSFHLNEYREEMKAFTIFLKQKFLNSN